MPIYRFEPTVPDESRLSRLADFLRSVFPNALCFSPEYLHWMYFRNPDGAVTGIEGYAGDTLVGHHAVIPIRIQHDGVERAAGLAVNISTDPAHRGHGLFRELTSTTHAAFEATGRDLVIAVANDQSTDRSIQRLSYRLVGPLDARLGLAGECLDLATDGRSAFRRLWSPESFAWRFSNPSWFYRFERNDSVTRVYTPTRRFAIEAEMGVFPGDWPLPAQKRRYPLLRHPLKLWLGLRPGAGEHWPVSMEIPRPLRPSPLNLIVRDSRAGAEPPAHDRVAFRGADFDPY